MPAIEPSPKHFLEYFYADMRARADQPLLCEKQGAVYNIVSLRESATRIANVSRAFFAAGLGPSDRVALHAGASPALLIAEWAVIASRAVAVIVPRSFSADELIETLIESKARIIILDRLATAYHLAGAAASLPDLKCIVCLEGSTQAELHISSWNEFIEAGQREADRGASLLRLIEGKDTALMFYYKDAEHGLKAVRYTHALLMEHAARIETLLGDAGLKNGELVLTATAWEHPVGHVASCYAPVLKDALVQITYGTPDIVLFENAPQVIVGDALFFGGVRQNILTLVRQSGRIESYLLDKALALSKKSYESAKNTSLLKSFLKATIIKKVQKLLGGRARLFIGIDDEAHYDIQLFFHAFGIELIELPQEAFR